MSEISMLLGHLALLVHLTSQITHELTYDEPPKRTELVILFVAVGLSLTGTLMSAMAIWR